MCLVVLVKKAVTQEAPSGVMRLVSVAALSFAFSD